jgi:16S rRNA (cytosine967-C5)-methyltransferase
MSRPARLTPALFEHAEEVLAQVLRFEFPADGVLSHYFRENREIGHADRGFIAETVYAVLRRWRSLEARCGGWADIRLLLLAALVFDRGFNLRELDGLLRGDEREMLAKAKGFDLDSQPIAIRTDLPDWLAEKLLPDYDEATLLAMAASLNRMAPLDLRVNPMKISREDALEKLKADGIPATATQLSPLAIRLSGKPALSKYPLFIDGSLEVQDEGSQMLGMLVAPRRGEMVVDFCAGAGGKTLLLGALMRNTGRLYAIDISEKRLGKLKPRLARSGLSNVHPIRIEHERDTKLKRLAGKADRVLVDAPCSGLGTLRRNPDLKWRQNAETVAELSAKQLSILEAAAKLVRPGGRLIYATCSLLRDENTAIAEAFLAQKTEFTLISVHDILKQELESTGPMLQLLPHIHGTDGFFAAVFERSNPAA